MHHHHLLFGSSHDVRGEDELAKTLRTKKKPVTKLIYSPAHKSSTFRKHCTAFDPILQKNIQYNYKLIILVIAVATYLTSFFERVKLKLYPYRTNCTLNNLILQNLFKEAFCVFFYLLRWWKETSRVYSPPCTPPRMQTSPSGSSSCRGRRSQAELPRCCQTPPAST